MIRTEVFKKEGGLDGRFFAHMEEIDLCWRLKSRGWNIACIPQSVVYHVGGATLNKSNPRKTYLNFRNNLLMIYKNASSERVGAILKWRMLLDYLAAAQMMLTLKWRDAAAVCKARKEFKRIKSEFEPSRQENMQKTNCRDIPEMMQGSILWHYYIKGRHCFSRLRQQ
jgi:GT2 family glycosyltransferase